MKKIFILALAVTSMAIISCQKSEFVPKGANVTINVGCPVSKAISDGTTATNLVYEIYHVDESENFTLVTDAQTTLENLSATLNFTLMRDNKYVALFWAQSPKAPYGTEDLRRVEMNYVGDQNGNNEHRDAFAGHVEFTASDDLALVCPLTRPFSQINFVASDYETRQNTNIKSLTLTGSEITISSVATLYNVYTDKASNPQTDPGSYSAIYYKSAVAGGETAIITEEFDTNYKADTWISMNYVLLPYQEQEIKVSAVFNVTATYSTNNQLNHVITFPATTVKAGVNYRTNIMGEIFTEGGKINITVEPGYAKPDNTVTVD